MSSKTVRLAQKGGSLRGGRRPKISDEQLESHLRATQDATNQMSVAAVCSALRSLLQDIEERTPHPDSALGAAFDAKRVWTAIVHELPGVWRFAGDVEMANASLKMHAVLTATQQKTARYAVSNEKVPGITRHIPGPLVYARHLRCSTLPSRELPGQLALILWLAECFIHGNSGDGAAAHIAVLRLYLAELAPLPEKIQHVTDAELLDIVAIWADRKAGPKLGDKWERLAAFARTLGAHIEPETFKKASRKQRAVVANDLDDFLSSSMVKSLLGVSASGEPRPEAALASPRSSKSGKNH